MKSVHSKEPTHVRRMVTKVLASCSIDIMKLQGIPKKVGQSSQSAQFSVQSLQVYQDDQSVGTTQSVEEGQCVKQVNANKPGEKGQPNKQVETVQSTKKDQSARPMQSVQKGQYIQQKKSQVISQERPVCSNQGQAVSQKRPICSN